MTSTDRVRTRDESTPARGHLPVLDAYRAMAAVAVVASHVGFQTGQTVHGLLGVGIARLDVGVALFFALSGFLLYRPWAVALESGGHGPVVRGYLWHRALRILPAFWVVTVVALLALPENDSATTGTWVANLTLTQIYVPQTIAAGLTQMWSLSTEVAFYVALPLLAEAIARVVRFSRSPLAAALGVSAGLVAANVLWSAWVHQDGQDAGLPGFWLPNFASWFAVGLALAALAARIGSGGPLPAVLRPVVALSDQPGACWSMALGLFLVAATPVAGPRAFEALPTAGQAVTKNLLYAGIVLTALLPASIGRAHGRFHRTLSAPPFRRVGDISYGIFLWHLVVLAWVFTVTGRPLFSGGFWPVLAETLLGTLAVAATSWVVLEKPVLRLKSRVPV